MNESKRTPIRNDSGYALESPDAASLVGNDESQPGIGDP